MNRPLVERGIREREKLFFPQTESLFTGYCVGIVGIVFEPIVVISVGFPFSKKDRIFVFPHFRNSREKSMRRKLVPIPFTIFGEHGVMAHVP